MCITDFSLKKSIQNPRFFPWQSANTTGWKSTEVSECYWSTGISQLL